MVLSAIMMQSCAEQAQVAAPTPSYPTIKVKSGNLVENSEFSAELQSRNVVEIRSRATGYVDKIYVEEGAVVRKGQPIVKIDQRDYSQRVLAAEAAVKSAKANYDNAALEVHKLEPLVEKNIISNFQLETAQSQAASAQAILGQAEHQLAEARINLGFTVISSPVDGVIGTYDIRVGSLVSATEQVTTVSAKGDMFAYFAFDEKKLLSLKQAFGQDKSMQEMIAQLPEAELVKADGTIYTHKGIIEAASGIVNQTTGSIQLKAVFPNPDGELNSGSMGRVRIPVSYENVMLVPQKSTFETQDKRMVYIVNADSTVASKAIVTSGAAGGNYVVEGGIDLGQTIIYEGISLIRQGMKVAPRDTIPSQY